MDEKIDEYERGPVEGDIMKDVRLEKIKESVFSILSEDDIVTDVMLQSESEAKVKKNFIDNVARGDGGIRL